MKSRWLRHAPRYARRPATSALPKKKRGVKVSPDTVYPLACIEWDDHHSNNAWVEPAELDGAPAKVITVGWLVKEDSTSVVLAMTMQLDDGTNKPFLFANTSTIMKVLITKRKILRKSKTL